MFRNSILIVLTGLAHAYVFGQARQFTLKVEYEYYRKAKASPFTLRYNSTLTANEKSSVYEVNLLQRKDSVNTIRDAKGSYTLHAAKSNSFYYKDLANNTIVNRERILIREFFVHDSLDIFEWVIGDERKEILGYKCQSATTHFRGRDYKAYFTTSLPVRNGPWKFHGLPGLILDVRSSDESFTIIAQSLSLTNDKTDVVNPYEKERIISRKEYEELYIKKYKEITSYKLEEGVEVSMPKGGIEIIIKE